MWQGSESPRNPTKKKLSLAFVAGMRFVRWWRKDYPWGSHGTNTTHPHPSTRLSLLKTSFACVPCPRQLTCQDGDDACLNWSKHRGKSQGAKRRDPGAVGGTQEPEEEECADVNSHTGRWTTKRDQIIAVPQLFCSILSVTMGPFILGSPSIKTSC